MKVLVIQLARLGDCFLSWPAIRALKQKNPEWQITVLTRQKFAAAFFGLEGFADVIQFDVRQYLEPVVADEPNLVEAHRRLQQAVVSLGKFDHVINLSFSPASSWLTYLLQPGAKIEHVTGYTRTEDGYLAIPDDMSAYFYAQVGPGRSNRFHLAEIFGTLCEVDLQPADWDFRATVKDSAGPELSPYIVLHVGASESHKTVSAEKWANVIGILWQKFGHPIHLIGAQNESHMAETIESSTPEGSVINQVGTLTLQESMALIAGARLLVGADSAPIHMASLVATPTVNVSVGNVNFWETGPRAAGSVVLRADDENEIPSDRIAKAAECVMTGMPPEVGVIQVIAGAITPSYRGLFPREQEMSWQLVQALYQGTDFPDVQKLNHFTESLVQVIEVNNFLLETLHKVSQGAPLENLAGVLDRGEEILQTIPKLVPAWGPIIRWYQTEKVRILPGTHQEVVARTIEIHNLFAKLLNHLGEICLSEQQALTSGEMP